MDFLIILFNYATPKSAKNDYVRMDKYDRMKLSEGCLSLLKQSFPTLLLRAMGEEKRDVDGSTMSDRLFWCCDTNQPDYVDEIQPTCDDAELTEDEMNFLALLMVSLKVIHQNKLGNIPTFLPMGASVRDACGMSESSTAQLTPCVVRTAALPHSQMLQNGGLMCFWYDDAQMSKMSTTVALAFAHLFMVRFGYRIIEKFSGADDITPEEKEERDAPPVRRQPPPLGTPGIWLC